MFERTTKRGTRPTAPTRSAMQYTASIALAAVVAVAVPAPPATTGAAHAAARAVDTEDERVGGGDRFAALGAVAGGGETDQVVAAVLAGDRVADDGAGLQGAAGESARVDRH